MGDSEWATRNGRLGMGSEAGDSVRWTTATRILKPAADGWRRLGVGGRAGGSGGDSDAAASGDLHVAASSGSDSVASSDSDADSVVVPAARDAI